MDHSPSDTKRGLSGLPAELEACLEKAVAQLAFRHRVPVKVHQGQFRPAATTKDFLVRATCCGEPPFAIRCPLHPASGILVEIAAKDGVGTLLTACDVEGCQVVRVGAPPRGR